jgi:hypothetical protein
MRYVIASVSALLVVMLSAPTAVATAKRFYLSLGDSLGYGIPSGAGYTDVVGERLREARPRMRTVNYSCPGESTTSFISGGCPWPGPLHDAYSGSQLDAAVAFLRAHRGRVGPITLSLWGNDVTALVRSCAGDLECVEREAPAAIRAFSANLTLIMGRLLAAAPDADIVVTGTVNINVGYFPQTDPLYDRLNREIANVARHSRAEFADTFQVFNPQGDVAVETATICRLTLICSHGDSHPSEEGYRAIAALILDAAGHRGPIR